MMKHNRPWSRYAVRLYCLIRYGRAGGHAEEWWPDLRLSLVKGREGRGEIVYKGRRIAPLLPYPPSLPDREELIVVGSGPSLASQATERIPLESAFLLNGAIHLLGRYGGRPFGLVVEDDRFIYRHWRTLVETVPAETECYFSTGAIRALCEKVPGWLAGQKVHHLDFVNRPYDLPRPSLEGFRKLPFLVWSDEGNAAISLAPQAGLMPAGSVAVTAAQIVLSLAPRRIGFAGIDLTATNQPRFYEKEGDTAMSRLHVAQKRILAAFRLIRKEGGNRGIAIENYSPISLLGSVGIAYSPRLEY